MADIKEYLKENLTEEQFKTIEEAELKGEVYTEPMAPVRRINEVTAEKKNIEDQLTKQNELIDTMKADAELTDTLKEKITTMEKEKKEIAYINGIDDTHIQNEKRLNKRDKAFIEKSKKQLGF